MNKGVTVGACAFLGIIVILTLAYLWAGPTTAAQLGVIALVLGVVGVVVAVVRQQRAK